MSHGREHEPQTAPERLQAAREGRGEDRSAEIERNVESADQELTEQGRERERTLERERMLEQERERSIAHERPTHSI